MPYSGMSGARIAMARFLACCIIVFTLSFSSFAQQKLDQLLVYGDNFLFSVKEPAGWKGDTASAEQFQSNVVLHEATQPPESLTGLIRVRLNDKTDENISADMKDDIRSYKTQYPKIQFKDIAIRNPGYPAIAKVFYIPGQFYEYVAYMNPGRGKPFIFSVAMNTQKSEATAKQLGAYESTLASLKRMRQRNAPSAREASVMKWGNERKTHAWESSAAAEPCRSGATGRRI